MEKSFKERAKLLESAIIETEMLVNAIYFHRERQKMSREELAFKSGLELEVVEKLENFRISPDMYAIFMMLHALGLTLLIGDKGNSDEIL